MRDRSLPAPAPWLPVIAEGKHGYDLEYQLPTSALIFNIILKRRFHLLLNQARHRRHPDLLLCRIRRSIIREIIANAAAVGSKSIHD